MYSEGLFGPTNSLKHKEIQSTTVNNFEVVEELHVSILCVA